MLTKLQNKFKSEDNKRLLTNFLSLSVLQGANFILPLISLPYLVRILGTEAFGLVMFAQAVIMYFVILTDYGFNLSATREISIYRDNIEKVAEIFSTVIFIKFILLLVSFILLSIIIFSFEKFRTDWYIYYLTFGMAIGQVLFPVWFFQGVEKMKYITILNIIAKLIFTVSIFIFIQKVEDYFYVPILNSLGFIVAGLISLWIVFHDFKIRLVTPNYKSVRNMFFESSNLFISNLSVTLYTASNTLILGLFTDNNTVGIYASIEKLVLAIKNLYVPLYQALFPWLSKKHKDDIAPIIKKMIPYIALIGVFFTVVLVIFAKEILTLVYNRAEIIEYATVFQIMALISIFASLNMLFNMLYLTSVKAYKERMAVMLKSGLFNLITVIILTYFYSLYGTAIAITSTELLLLLFGFYYFKKMRIHG
jgi:PST family polysaccharide transporter